MPYHSIAKKNILFLWLFILTIEILPFFVSRILHIKSVYNIVEKVNIESIVILSLNIIFILFLVTINSLTKVRTSYNYTVNLSWVLYLALTASIINLIIFDSTFRYIAGGMQGVTGRIYIVNNILYFLTIFLTSKYGFNALIKKEKTLLIIYLLINVALLDGLSSFLNFFFSILLLRNGDSKIKFISVIRKSLLLYPFLLLVIISALYLKFGNGESLSNDIKEITDWSISRFAIKIESFLLFLNDLSVYSNISDVLETIKNSFFSKLNFLYGEENYSFPKTFSEGVFYDLYDVGASGSSPGVIYGLAVTYYGFGIIMLIILLSIKKYLFSIQRKITKLQLFSLAFFLSNILSDIPDWFSPPSPAFLYMLAFIGASMLNIKKE